jgi:hypothetical protein
MFYEAKWPEWRPRRVGRRDKLWTEVAENWSSRLGFKRLRRRELSQSSIYEDSARFTLGSLMIILASKELSIDPLLCRCTAREPLTCTSTRVDMVSGQNWCIMERKQGMLPIPEKSITRSIPRRSQTKCIFQCTWGHLTSCLLWHNQDPAASCFASTTRNPTPMAHQRFIFDRNEGTACSILAEASGD